MVLFRFGCGRSTFPMPLPPGASLPPSLIRSIVARPSVTKWISVSLILVFPWLFKYHHRSGYYCSAQTLSITHNQQIEQQQRKITSIKYYAHDNSLVFIYQNGFYRFSKTYLSKLTWVSFVLKWLGLTLKVKTHSEFQDETGVNYSFRRGKVSKMANKLCKSFRNKKTHFGVIVYFVASCKSWKIKSFVETWCSSKWCFFCYFEFHTHNSFAILLLFYDFRTQLILLFPLW